LAVAPSAIRIQVTLAFMALSLWFRFTNA